MRRDVIGAFLFAFMLPGCVQDQPPPSAQAPDSHAAATPQQAEPVRADCGNFAPLPGQGREYNLFANMTSGLRGCAAPSAVTYQKGDGQAAPSQQEALDRAACRSEAERAANGNHGLQAGEYDIFKSNMAAQSADVDRFEQSCMTQRGYKSVAN
jgi:hypothetical protein